MVVTNLTSNMVPAGEAASEAAAIEAYGEISAQGNSSGETTVDGTYRKITAWNTNGLSKSVVPDHATGNDLTHPLAGIYRVDASISFSGTASKTFEIALYVSGSTTGFILERKLGGGGDVGRATLIGIVELAANDTLELYQKSSDGGSAMLITEGVLTSFKIGVAT